MKMPIVAYMTSAYPARSHTFIRREIEQLELQGFEVHRFSQRRCSQADILDEIDEREYKATKPVFPLDFLECIKCHAVCFFKSPANYLVTLIRSLRFSPPGIMGLFYGLVYFAQGMTLVRALRETNVEKMHIHFANSGMFVGVAASEYLGLPWSVSVHGRSDFDYPGAAALPTILEKSEFLRCISGYGAAQVMRQTAPKYWKKIQLSYCGLPDEYIDEQIQKERNNSGPLTLLSVGRLSAEKGQFLLLDLASSLKALGVSIEVIIVGDGPDRSALEASATHLNVADVCRFVGAVGESEVIEHMRRADIFLCPSLMEGLPQVLMEAMAVKLPVVAPYLAGIPELIHDGETGLLYVAGDGDSLLFAVRRFISSSDLCSTCAENAYRQLKKRFLLSATITPLIDRLSQAPVR